MRFKSLTGKDNETGDIGRILLLVSVAAYILFGAVVLCKVMMMETPPTPIFDFIAWGTGLGVVVGAFGGMLWLKKDTEPEVPKDGNPSNN